jgi:general secretion pathway protein N
MAPAHRLSLLLFTGGALLCGVAAVAFMQPPPRQSTPVAEAPRPATSVVLPAGAGPFEQYRETAARPLFSPTRRPPAAVEATPAPAPKPVSLRLDGLIVTRDRKEAMITESGEGKRLRLREGDTVAGWTVRRIERDKVLLTSPTDEMTLSPGQ